MAPQAQVIPGSSLAGGDQLTTPQPGKEAIGGNGGPDWRALLAGEDVKALERLARYQNPTDVTKALLEAQTKLSQRAEPPKFPDNATPQQVAEWRKGLGVADVPADAKPDAYMAALGITIPEGYTPTAYEAGLIGDYAKLAYDQGMAPREVKAATAFFWKQQAAGRQAMNHMDLDKQKGWLDGLREEWGRDFDGKVAAGEQFLNSHFGDDAAGKSELLNARLPGGGKLGDNPQFIKLMTDLALKSGMTDRIETSAIESGGKSLAEQQMELQRLYMTDRRKYDLPETQAKLDKIIALRRKQGQIDEIGNEIQRRSA